MAAADKNPTLIASVSTEGMWGLLRWRWEGHHREAFQGYAQRFLAPSLKGRQLVVMAHLSAYESDRVRELIEGRGRGLVLVPSYSPGLDPMEEAFAKAEALVRKAVLAPARPGSGR
ncbi:MAG: hypothetical protein M3R38_06330 [Actinomycetota bacterium]|nr:hypothetical protein [Actinomycetota bacterium]